MRRVSAAIADEAFLAIYVAGASGTLPACHYRSNLQLCRSKQRIFSRDFEGVRQKISFDPTEFPNANLYAASSDSIMTSHLLLDALN